MPFDIRRLLPIVLPVGLLVAALVLPGYMFWSARSGNVIGLGPGAWPNGMLRALGFFALLWIMREIWVLGGADRPPTLRPAQDEDRYAFGKALGGIAMIAVYGMLLPVTGFALTTCVFIAAWCIYGGLRNMMIVVPVTLIGTVALLWLFMGLALMPLPRGQGRFAEFSIWLLRATGIY
jgi:putative tricarboxylic transport membrane protein